MKSTATVADLRPSEKLIADRMQGKNGSLKRVKSPITATSYTVASLQTATNSFSQENLIAEGSLGRVYRGEFPNGKVNCCSLICTLKVFVPSLLYCFLFFGQVWFVVASTNMGSLAFIKW